MKIKNKKSKAFIFTITAIYVVILFMFLLNIYGSLDTNAKLVDRFKFKRQDTITNFLNNDSPTTYSNLGWCNIYYKYDANSSSLSSQATLETKKYCEEYER
jgi:hypothetical protein